AAFGGLRQTALRADRQESFVSQSIIHGGQIRIAELGDREDRSLLLLYWLKKGFYRSILKRK
ncbi:MAG: hypothetical protein ACERKO_10760, partial [Acetanaerobacterium sp.]